MARTDAIVLGAGIVGISAALHLAKRGLAVALVDRRGPGEETSYGNTGIIEGNTLFAHAFPKGFGALLRIALKQAPEATYHLSALPGLAPWLLAYRANTRGERALQFAKAMRPLYARAVAEHEALMGDANATRYLRKDGWLKLYRSDGRLPRRARTRLCDRARPHPSRAEPEEGARSARRSRRCSSTPCIGRRRQRVNRSPSPGLCVAVPLLGGITLKGDARTPLGDGWQVDTDEGPLDARTWWRLGPWAPDVLGPLGIRLPLAFSAAITGTIVRRQRRPDAPVVDTDYGYCLAPMEQGIRLTTGAGSPPAMTRRRRCRSAACAGGAGAVPAGRRDRGAAGWDRGRALPIPGR